MKQTIRSSYAKFDPVHLLDGLFIPMKGQSRKRRLYVAPRRFGDVEISFQGFEQLGADDQSVLLAITAQLGIDGLLIGSSPTAISKSLLDGLELAHCDGVDIATKKISLRSLSIDAGYSPSRSTDIVAASLNRLSNAQIREENTATGWDQRSNLIRTKFNRKTKEIYIAANPRITNAVFNGQHVRVSLFERNALETEVAKLLHCWLSSNIRLGASLGIGGNGAKIDTLAAHIWGTELETETAKVRCTRRGHLKDALIEIADKTKNLKGGNGWVIDLTESGLAYVGRPDQLPLFEHTYEMVPSDVIGVLTP